MGTIVEIDTECLECCTYPLPILSLAGMNHHLLKHCLVFSEACVTLSGSLARAARILTDSAVTRMCSVTNPNCPRLAGQPHVVTARIRSANDGSHPSKTPSGPAR